jgi:hypothetical protein
MLALVTSFFYFLKEVQASKISIIDQRSFKASSNSHQINLLVIKVKPRSVLQLKNIKVTVPGSAPVCPIYPFGAIPIKIPLSYFIFVKIFSFSGNGSLEKSFANV